ncbi:MAG: hypothetical protein AAF340_06955 [Pseudomonadota bacterium]
MRILAVAICYSVVAEAAISADHPAIDAVATASYALFDDMPALKPVPRIEGTCGADAHVHPQMAYCTSANAILIHKDAERSPVAGYELAHLMGHAVQVRHGVADIALREIRRRPLEEAKLRGWVTSQVECIAGFLYNAAGGRAFDLEAAYTSEPFTGSHWGRNPLSKGPRVSIGTAARQHWFDLGLKGDLGACAPGAFSADLLLEALIPTQ